MFVIYYYNKVFCQYKQSREDKARTVMQTTKLCHTLTNYKHNATDNRQHIAFPRLPTSKDVFGCSHL